MIKIDQLTVDELKDAQDKASEGFWTYPDSDWQEAFQAQWLEDRIGSRIATSPDGLVWGK